MKKMTSVLDLNIWDYIGKKKYEWGKWRSETKRKIYFTEYSIIIINQKIKFILFWGISNMPLYPITKINSSYFDYLK